MSIFCPGFIYLFLTFLLAQTVKDACVMLNQLFWETYRDFLLASIYSNQHQTTLSCTRFPLFSQIITKVLFFSLLVDSTYVAKFQSVTTMFEFLGSCWGESTEGCVQ